MRNFDDTDLTVEAMPLVSVIITAFNHGRYLPDSIGSVLAQTYRPFELIVVDDGSTDDTREVVSRFPEARYIYQENRGLSAARNTGVARCKGAFVVFLDADDLLYPQALALNIGYFRLHPECAFVSGGHNLVDEEKKLGFIYDNVPCGEDSYLALLEENYIGMHASVMYRREMVERYPYDERLQACEDYDIYLRIARHHPIFSHLEPIAAYRKHTANMSHQYGMMLRYSLKVLEKNTDPAYGPAVRESYLAGKRNLRNYYAAQAWPRLVNRRLFRGPLTYLRDVRLVASTLTIRKSAGYLWRCLKKGRRFGVDSLEKIRRRVSRRLAGLGRDGIPRKGGVSLGHLKRLVPFSQNFGYERGGPVDRYYIENFLGEQAGYIQGRVLEIGDDEYTRLYGKERATKRDILHVDASNPKATFIGDLSHAGHIPDALFDCIVLTQTLHLIYDFQTALAHCHRLLKPGGTLLLTVPGISQIDYGEWGETWYWSFTGKSIRRALAAHFDEGDVLVQTYGNVLTATAFLYGMGLPEISQKEMDYHDPHYQLIITARAVKQAS